MRINKFVASSTGLSRRTADTVIQAGRIQVNGHIPSAGYDVGPSDIVTLDGKAIEAKLISTTIMLNKPPGYVCSREGQGSKTVYELLPSEYHALKPVGRLDKDSSGLLLMTTDGELAHQLTHPSFQKNKQYTVELDKPLQPLHRQMIQEMGITLEDGISQLNLERLLENDDHKWLVTMHEGRNRQIRRTFAALGYGVTYLHRTIFGPYRLDALPEGQFTQISE